MDILTGILSVISVASLVYAYLVTQNNEDLKFELDLSNSKANRYEEKFYSSVEAIADAGYELKEIEVPAMKNKLSLIKPE